MKEEVINAGQTFLRSCVDGPSIAPALKSSSIITQLCHCRMLMMLIYNAPSAGFGRRQRLIISQKIAIDEKEKEQAACDRRRGDQQLAEQWYPGFPVHDARGWSEKTVNSSIFAPVRTHRTACDVS